MDRDSHRIVLLVHLLVIAFVGELSAADRIRTPFDEDVAQRVDAVVLPIIESQEAVGYAVGVVEDGEVVYCRGYGLADREKKIPVDRETLFRWASVSKPVTAVSAMQLVEKGRLDLDDDVRTYVPEFPDKGVRITTRQLLCHQSGIRHYSNGKILPNRRTYSTEHPFRSVILAIDEFKDSPLLFPPGDRFSYSTHAYILASAVVERAGKQRFAKQVHDRIARPLGMRTFQPDYAWKKIPNRAVGYRRVANVVLRSGDSDVSWKLGGGGFVSSIDDMALFAGGMARRELMRRETWDLMWTPQRDSNGRETSYGLGFRVSGADGGLRVEHSGSQQKARTHLVVLPNLGLAVVAMSNSEYANPKKVCDAVLAMMRDG